jgi:hypothetical protein
LSIDRQRVAKPALQTQIMGWNTLTGQFWLRAMGEAVFRVSISGMYFQENVMDNYRQDSSYAPTSGLKPADFKPLTSEETASYRSWRRSVLAFYAVVVLVGGIGIFASIPVSNHEVAEVSSR